MVRAEVGELALALRIYADRKMPQFHVRVSQLKPRGLPAVGDEVHVEGGGSTCRGRVVAHVAVIEVDPETQDAKPTPGQMGLG